MISQKKTNPTVYRIERTKSRIEGRMIEQKDTIGKMGKMIISVDKSIKSSIQKYSS